MIANDVIIVDRGEGEANQSPPPLQDKQPAEGVARIDRREPVQPTRDIGVTLRV
jgi:hypothetical protein